MADVIRVVNRPSFEAQERIPLEPILIPIWPDAAKLVGLGRTTMFELVAEGRIATVKVGRKRLVAPDELRAFARRLAVAAAA